MSDYEGREGLCGERRPDDVTSLAGLYEPEPQDVAMCPESGSSGSLQGAVRPGPVDEDSATVFIPPELYKHMLHSEDRPVSVSVRAAPASEPHSVTGHYVRPQGEELPNSRTLCSARDDEAPQAVRPYAMAALTTPPGVTMSGTIVMQAVPYLPPRAESPRVEVVAPLPMPPAPPPAPYVPGPESARVRRALDEMSMLIDIDSMQRKVATASDDEVARYVEAMRRSEGLAPNAESPQAALHPHHHQQHPSSPPPAFPAVGWQPGAPHATAFAQQMRPQGPMHVQMMQPGHPVPIGPPPGSLARPSAPPQAKKPSSAALLTLFAVMFLMTMVGVGAVTYVALRGGHVANRAATTNHAVD